MQFPVSWEATVNINIFASKFYHRILRIHVTDFVISDLAGKWGGCFWATFGWLGAGVCGLGHYFWNRLDNVQFGHELKNQFILCLLFVFFLCFPFCHLQKYVNLKLFFMKCDKRFFWNEFMVKELLNSEVGFLFNVHGMVPVLLQHVVCT